MKKVMLVVCLFSTFATTAKPMTCKCTSGSMVLTLDGDRFEMSCTDGGRVSCTL